MKGSFRSLLGVTVAVLTLCVYTEATVFLDLPSLLSVDEGTDLTVCVNLTEPLDTQGQALVTTSTFSAEGTDITALSDTLTFNPGVTDGQCLQVSLIADDIVEVGEIFSINLSSMDIPIDINRQQSVVTIMDTSRIVIAFEQNEFTGQEGSPVQVCAVIAQGQVERDVTFQISGNLQGSATIGDDYLSVSGDLRTFNSETSRACVNITLLQDMRVEGNEYFEILLLAATLDAITIQDQNGTVVIQDNDGVSLTLTPTVVSVSEGNDGMTPVSVCVGLNDFMDGLFRSIPINLTTISGSADSEDYEVLDDEQWMIPSTTAEGETVCRSINVVGDTIMEGNEIFRVRLETADSNDAISGQTILRVTIVNDGDVLQQCPELNDITSGAVSIVPTNRIQGATATYTCDQGFEISGSETRTCDPSGNWGGSEPSCQVVDCSTPPSIVNSGTPQFTATTYLSQALYMCESGYEFSNGMPTFARMCLESGEWSNLIDAPTCEPVDCGTPPTLLNSTPQFSTMTFRSEATYTCNSGHEFNTGAPTFTRMCQANGDWSDLNNPPTCERVGCGSPPSIPNSTPEYTSTTFESDATYTCDSGYEFSSGASTFTRTCQATGEWNSLDNAPTCELVDCGGLPDIENGQVDDATTTFGATATYTCNTNYMLNGDSQRTCQSDMTWSGTAPQCDIITCPTLEAPVNGSVTSSNTVGMDATYSCDEGFGVSGEETRTCMETGNWSGTAPVCIVVCDELSLANGQLTYSTEGLRVVNSTVTATCNSDRTLAGDGVRTCGENGEWSGTTAVCNPMTSGPLGVEDDNTTMVIAIAVGVGGGALLLIVVISVVVVALLVVRRKKIYKKYVLPYRTYIYANSSVRNRPNGDKPLRDNDITIFENDTRQHALDAVEALDKPKP